MSAEISWRKFESVRQPFQADMGASQRIKPDVSLAAPSDANQNYNGGKLPLRNCQAGKPDVLRRAG